MNDSILLCLEKNYAKWAPVYWSPVYEAFSIGHHPVKHLNAKFMKSGLTWVWNTLLTEFRTVTFVCRFGVKLYCLELLVCNLANFLSSMYVLLEVINTSCIKNEMCRACGPPFLVNVLLMFETLYLTLPILVHFLGLGALFNESFLPNVLVS